MLQGNASGIVIGCLRANESSFAENASTLESLSRLDEHFHEKHGLDDGFIDGQEGHAEHKYVALFKNVELMFCDSFSFSEFAMLKRLRLLTVSQWNCNNGSAIAKARYKILIS